MQCLVERIKHTCDDLFSWQEFAPEKKRKFEIMCTDDKARYKREMFSYIPPLAPKEEVCFTAGSLFLALF